MSKLTPTMINAVELAKKNENKLIRYPGGYWAGRDWKMHEKSFGTNTIHALVTRNVAEYSEYKKGRNGEFPIAITLIIRKENKGE